MNAFFHNSLFDRVIGERLVIWFVRHVLEGRCILRSQIDQEQGCWLQALTNFNSYHLSRFIEVLLELTGSLQKQRNLSSIGTRTVVTPEPINVIAVHFKWVFTSTGSRQ